LSDGLETVVQKILRVPVDNDERDIHAFIMWQPLLFKDVFAAFGLTHAI
jgi:hypothetical protein